MNGLMQLCTVETGGNDIPGILEADALHSNPTCQQRRQRNKSTCDSENNGHKSEEECPKPRFPESTLVRESEFEQCSLASFLTFSLLCGQNKTKKQKVGRGRKEESPRVVFQDASPRVSPVLGYWSQECQ